MAIILGKSVASSDRRVHRLPCSGTAVIEGPLGGAALLTERRKKPLAINILYSELGMDAFVKLF